MPSRDNERKKRWGLNFSYFYSEYFLLVLEGTALLVGLKLTHICLTWLLLLQAAQFVRAAFIARPPPCSSPAVFLTTAATENWTLRTVRRKC